MDKVFHRTLPIFLPQTKTLIPNSTENISTTIIFVYKQCHLLQAYKKVLSTEKASNFLLPSKFHHNTTLVMKLEMVGFALACIKLLTYIVHLKWHFRITVLFPTNVYENPHSKLFKIFPFF